MIPAVCPLPGIQQYLSLYSFVLIYPTTVNTAYELDVTLAKSANTLVNCVDSDETPTQDVLRVMQN